MRDRVCREVVLELSVVSCREDSGLESLLLDRLLFCFVLEILAELVELVEFSAVEVAVDR